MTPDVAQAVRNAKAGQVQFRVDKAGIVHATIGRRSFDSDKLVGNLRALIEALNKAKAGVEQGHLPAQGRGVVDDGCGRAGGRGVDQRRAGAGLTRQFGRRAPTGAASCEMVGRADERPRRVIQDRWCSPGLRNRGRRSRKEASSEASADGGPAKEDGLVVLGW